MALTPTNDQAGWRKWWGPTSNPNAVFVPVAPAPGSAPKPTYATDGSGRGAAGSGGSGGNGSASSNSGDGGIKKSNDKPQIDALRKMLESSFARARDTKLGNISRILGQQEASLLLGYDERAEQLSGAREDNEKAEHDSSFANLVNRARETADLLAEAALQGAGESDTLKVQLQAVRNWDANQGDINRSYFDTLRSVNSAFTDLNADTRNARINMHTQALSDQDQVWSNYYNQRADAYSQLGNISANPYSDQHGKASDAFGKMADEAGQSWTNPGIPKPVQDWQGEQPKEGRLNNAKLGEPTNLAKKAPEGATLRKW